MKRRKSSPKKKSAQKIVPFSPVVEETTPSIIVGGQVINPASGLNCLADIYLSDGKISKIETKKLLSKRTIMQQKPEAIINASGLYVIPGLVDNHVHLREPGREDEETILTGSEAAVAGGFTSICCMPNTQPPLDTQEAIKFIYERARFARCHVYPIGAATKGLKGEQLTEVGDLVAAGAVAISDDGKPIVSARIMRLALEYCRMFDIPVINHCEELGLTGDGVMNEGYTATVLGLPGVPEIAEEIMVARDIKLAEFTGGYVHIAHVSTAGSVELIRQAKARGIKVTCEVTPHHFTLTDELVKDRFDTNLRVNPPLRTRRDIQTILEGLQDGTIDCIVTDHAPHAIEEKDVEFDQAPPGMIGLETALGLVITELVKPGYLSFAQAIAKLTHRPAEILKLNAGQLAVGKPADIAIFDPETQWMVEESKFRSKSKNSPFIGRRLYGQIRYTIVSGRIVFAARPTN